MLENTQTTEKAEAMPSLNRKRSLPPAFCWERGHLGRHFSGRDARAPRGGERLHLAKPILRV